MEFAADADVAASASLNGEEVHQTSSHPVGDDGTTRATSGRSTAAQQAGDNKFQQAISAWRSKHFNLTFSRKQS